MKNPSVALQTAYYETLYGREDAYTDAVIDALVAFEPSLVCPCSVGATGALYAWVPNAESNIATPIVHDGAYVAVVSDIAPTATATPYIVLGEQTAVDDADKEAFGAVMTQGVSIVTQFDGDSGGKKLSSQLASVVTERIRTRERMDLSPDFNMITATLDNLLTITERTPTTTIIRTELRFRHIIEQT